MRREHWITISGFLILFAVLYLGCDTKSKETIAVEKSRALNFENIHIKNLRDQAVKSLDPDDRQRYLYLTQQLKTAENDTIQIELLKQIAGFWYEQEEILLSGDYANRIAEKEQTAESWSLAGTTFLLALKAVEDDNQRSFAHSNAIQSFEKAISENPENIQHKINLALCYVEIPEQDNPMKGIMQLLELNRSNPDNVAVILQLARLGIKTNQWDKAVERLNKAYTLEPTNKDVVCLLAVAYKGKGDMEGMKKFDALCASMN